MILLDTSVLISVWRGDAALEKLVASQICGVETIAGLEFLQGANKGQFRRAESFLARYDFVPFTAEVSYLALDLIKTYARTKGLRMGDALIAATCLNNNSPLWTINVRHFDFIPNLRLV